jgi:hypothetical protein
MTLGEFKTWMHQQVESSCDMMFREADEDILRSWWEEFAELADQAISEAEEEWNGKRKRGTRAL